MATRLDKLGVDVVINYDCPDGLKDYKCRARHCAGSRNRAVITMVTRSTFRKLIAMEVRMHKEIGDFCKSARGGVCSRTKTQERSGRSVEWGRTKEGVTGRGVLSEEAERVYVIEWTFTLGGEQPSPMADIVQMDVRACSQSTSSPTRFK